MDKPYIQVVAAILLSEGYFLIARRGSGTFAGLWEFPGGKIERGESVAEALARELFEELEISLDTFESILQYGFTFPHVNVDLHFLKANLNDRPNLMSHVHSGLKWITVDEIPKYQFLESNQPILNILATALR